MSKKNNLKDFVKDLADTLREKTGTTELINPQDFSQEIMDIPTGDNTFLKKLLAGTLTEVKASDLNGVEEINYPGFSGSRDTLTKITVPSGVKLNGSYYFNPVRGLEVILNKGISGGGYTGSSGFEIKSLRWNGTLEEYLEYVLTTGNNYSGYWSANFSAGQSQVSPPSQLRPSSFYIGDQLLTSVQIDNDVPQSAFFKLKCLSSLTVKGEGKDLVFYERCFYGSGLKSITLPSNVKSLEMHNSCFSDNNLAREISLPDVTYINFSNYNHIFSNCPSLQRINLPTTVSNIPEHFLYNCSRLPFIKIPSNITSVGNYAFQYCNSLIEICNNSSLSITAGSTSNGYLGQYAKHVYKEGEEESFLKQEGDFLFYEDGENTPYLMGYVGEEIADLVLPTQYKGADYLVYPFGLCGYYPQSLTVDTSKLNNTSYRMGLGSSYLSYAIGQLFNVGYTPSTEISPPNYSSKRFKYITSSNTVSYSTYRVPDSLKTLILLGPNIVGGDIENIVVRGSSLNANAFSGCENILKIVVEDTIQSIPHQAFTQCLRLSNVQLADSIQSIGNGAFNACYGLQEIRLPPNLTSIGTSAFASCTSLKQVIIPEGVSSIPQSCFSQCYKLYSITIPSSMSNIGSSAFNDRNLIEVVNDSALNISAGDTSSSYGYIGRYAKRVRTSAQESYIRKYKDEYIIYDDGQGDIYLLDIENTSEKVVLPIFDRDYILNGYSFYHQGVYSGVAIDTLEFSQGLKSIGPNAFQFSLLKELILPHQDTSLSIETYAFSSCQKLEAVQINSPVSLGNNAFSSCYYLKEVQIKKDFPLSVGSSSFVSCYRLEKVIGPIKYVGSSAFSSCNRLNLVDVEKCQRIENNAFYQCFNLRSVVLGEEVSYIGSYAFGYCNMLKKITIKATTPPTLFNTNAFYNTTNCPIYVPMSSVDTYKNATNWSSFANRIIGYEEE